MKGRKMHCSKCGFEDWVYAGRFGESEGKITLVYCPRCGQKLSEKCPDCGEMEWIGRPVCYREYQRILGLFTAVRENEQQYRPSQWILLLLMVGIFGSMFALFALMPPADGDFSRQDFATFLFGAVAISTIFTTLWFGYIKMHNRAVERSEQKFWSENPDLKRTWDRWQKWQQEDWQKWKESSKKE